jgi:hypothetical protein
MASQICCDTKPVSPNDVEACDSLAEGRHMRRREFITLLSGAAAVPSLSSWPLPARAQQTGKEAAAFPNRTIKIVVPFPAGGPSDVLARMIGQRMSEDWGQPVLIENRVGANTIIGAHGR